MKSEASYNGHPIHPMLVTLPIGLFVGSLVSDIVYLATRGVMWYDIAYWMMAFGVIGALAAAVPGLIDYNTTVRRSEHAYATARAHMIINLGVVAVYLVDLYVRHGYSATGGSMLAVAFILNLVTVGALGVSGWLGGELVYRYGIGMPKEAVRITMAEMEEERAPTRR